MPAARVIACFFSILTWILLAGYATAEHVQLEQQRGTYMVPVRINGQIMLPFVIDTGASEVAIPADVFLTLIRTHTVRDDDLIGIGTYTLADGSEQQSQRVILREMKVGDHVVKDVVANVLPVKGDPLLGQSFLSRLPAWAIDNDRHVLVLQDQPVGPPGGTADGLPIKTAIAFFGRCRYQLVAGFFPCGNPVAYNVLKNGRSLLTFWSDQAAYTLSGGKDRQPNLENYYLSIDTFSLKLKDKEETSDRGMEGECHFSLNRDSTRFFYIKCDVYNRAKDSSTIFIWTKLGNSKR
jgi:clan AA aspartic protease (TIGR02281 family)